MIGNFILINIMLLLISSIMNEILRTDGHRKSNSEIIKNFDSDNTDVKIFQVKGAIHIACEQVEMY